MTQRAPGKRVYHSSKRVRFGGGVYSDTRAGTRTAAARGDGWIDKNGHLMPKTVADKAKPVPLKSLVWLNAHGSPYNPPWVAKGKKISDYSWNQKKRQHPSLQNAQQCFQTCKNNGVKVEWEVKDVHPFASQRILDRMLKQLAKSAQRVWGADWQHHVIVKVLTNLSGGIHYAYKVLRAAYKAGFRTMILARGEWVHKVINEPFITWNRGGRVA